MNYIVNLSDAFGSASTVYGPDCASLSEEDAFTTLVWSFSKMRLVRPLLPLFCITPSGLITDQHLCSQITKRSLPGESGDCHRI